jgi:hypothetical protein
MVDASSVASEFFEAYARATGSPDPEFLGTAYADTFMFAGPGGVQAINKDDFLRVVSKRGAFFEAVGLAACEVRGLHPGHPVQLKDARTGPRRRGPRGSGLTASWGRRSLRMLDARSSSRSVRPSEKRRC